MSTTDASTIDTPIESADDAHAEDDHGHKSDWYYVQVAIVLAVITGLEVALSYIDFGDADFLFLPSLLILMAIKFFTVVGIFMHLRFDNRIFKWSFYSGLVLAVAVYVAALATFHFFS